MRLIPLTAACTLALALTPLLACYDAPVLARDEVLVDGLGIAWSPEEVVSPVDFEFFQGNLYVLGGLDSARVWRISLDGKRALAVVPLDGVDVGPPRMLESNQSLLYIAGYGTRDVYAIRPDGTLLGRPREIRPGRDFVPWITGEFLQGGTPGRPGVLVEALLPLPQREYTSGWGGLPRTERRSLPRGAQPPASDLFLESDGLEQLHVLMNASGALVRYDANGAASLVTWLPPDMISLGRASALRGYAQPMEHLANGLELSCDGYLWVSVGQEVQRIALFDPRDYRLVQSITLRAKDLPDAFWSECDGWVVGLSAKTGRLVIGKSRGATEMKGEAR